MNFLEFTLEHNYALFESIDTSSLEYVGEFKANPNKTKMFVYRNENIWFIFEAEGVISKPSNTYEFSFGSSSKEISKEEMPDIFDFISFDKLATSNPIKTFALCAEAIKRFLSDNYAIVELQGVHDDKESSNYTNPSIRSRSIFRSLKNLKDFPYQITLNRNLVTISK